MSAWQVAALSGGVAGAVIALFAMVRVLVSLAKLDRKTDELRSAVVELETSTSQLSSDVRAVLAATRGRPVELGNGNAPEEGSDDMGGASRPVSSAFANPVIKAKAFGTGTSRAARRLRQGRER